MRVPEVAGATRTEARLDFCPGTLVVRADRFVLKTPIEFEIDRATLRPTALALVDAVGDALKSLGERVELGHLGSPIRIRGSVRDRSSRH